MKRCILLFTLLFSCTAMAFDLAEQIDVLIAEKGPGNIVGIVIERLDTGERLVSHNAEQRFTPASITKSLTAYVAFKTLGPDYTFNTQTFYKNGNLYIRFVGDPSFTTPDLYALLDSVNLKKIDNIIIDDTVFEQPYYSRGWTYDSLNWYYAAPISSVILDENKVDVLLTPAATLRQPAILKLAEGVNDIILNSQVFTATEEESETTCQFNLFVSQENIIDAYGCWPISNKTSKLKVGLNNPNLYVKQAIERYFLNNQITIQGEILTGETPKGLKPIATHNSQPIAELAIPILRDSSNFYTEPLTKTLGKQFYHQGSFQAGSYAIQQQLNEILGINPDGVVLYDGSGGDSYNLLTPNAVAKVLRAAYFDDSIQPAYRNAEAKPGQTGTLKNRMTNLPAEANFSGKTGTGNNASNVAGTMLNAQNIPLVIVIMTNNNPQKYANAKQLEDQIIELVYKAPVAQLDSASPS